MLLVLETTAGSAELSSYLNFAPLAATTGKGKKEVVVLLRLLIPFTAKAESQLHQVSYPFLSHHLLPRKTTLSNMANHHSAGITEKRSLLESLNKLYDSLLFKTALHTDMPPPPTESRDLCNA